MAEFEIRVVLEENLVMPRVFLVLSPDVHTTRDFQDLPENLFQALLSRSIEDESIHW
jgi:hypothetical protein